MRKIIFGILGLLGLVVVGLLAAPFFIPASAYKDRIETAATEAMGRQVTIGEVTGVSLLPTPRFAVADLAMANMEGMSAPVFASVSAAELNVALFPLLGGRVDIEKFVLTEPELNLERNASGQANWVLDIAGEENTTSGTDEPASTPIRDISFGDVRLVDGLVRYEDRVSGNAYVAQDVDVTLTLDSLDRPFSATGSMLFEGSPTDLSLRISTLRRLMDDQSAKVALTTRIGENSIETSFDVIASTAAVDGSLDLQAPDLRGLLNTLKMPVSANTGFDNLSVKGAFSGSANALTFSEGQLTFDKISTRTDSPAQFSVDLAGERPVITGSLAISDLDLRPYLPEEPDAPAADRSGFPAWSDAEIDFSFLRQMDLDLSLATDSIVTHDIRFGASQVEVALTGGRLRATLEETNLYDGGGSGLVTVDASRSTPLIGAKFQLTGLNAQIFAREVMALDRLSNGVGSVDTDFTTQGTSMADFMRNLDGNGALGVNEGALEGIDIAKIVRTAGALLDGFQGGQFDVAALGNAIAEARGPASQTRFSDLETRFTIRDGLLNTDLARLEGPFYRIVGTGNVNLVDQTIDLVFLPTLFETIENEVGRDLIAPVSVTGSFSDPKIRFDTEALIRGAVEDRARDLLRGQGLDLPESGSLEDALKDQALGELNSLLGGDAEDGGQGNDDTNDSRDEEPEEPETSLEDELKDKALDAIFGGKKKEG